MTPDIITLGKPIANGFPLAAVVTRKEVRKGGREGKGDGSKIAQMEGVVRIDPPTSPPSLPHSPSSLPQIAESLPLSYFNTFGGGNLAMALGEATLDVVLKEKLQEKAERLGTMLRNMFEGLAQVWMCMFD